jgi:site-specific recombinase XerC
MDCSNLRHSFWKEEIDGTAELRAIQELAIDGTEIKSRCTFKN